MACGHPVLQHSTRQRFFANKSKEESLNRLIDITANLGMGSAPNTFHDFRKLPQELRIMIWKLAVEDAINQPRVVEVSLDLVERKFQSNQVPSLLIVNWEARLLCQNRFARGLVPEIHWAPLQPQLAPKPNVFFNFEIDTLYIRNIPGRSSTFKLFLMSLSRDDREKVCSLAVEIDAFKEGMEHHWYSIGEAWMSLTNLKRLILVHKTHTASGHEVVNKVVEAPRIRYTLPQYQYHWGCWDGVRAQAFMRFLINDIRSENIMSDPVLITPQLCLVDVVQGEGKVKDEVSGEQMVFAPLSDWVNTHGTFPWNYRIGEGFVAM